MERDDVRRNGWTRRACLQRGLGAVLALAGARAGAEEYLADARTAQALRFACPRAPLREALRALSQAAGLSLTAAPALAEEWLVGYVPARSLRETMQALEELFEAAWRPAGGGYRLEPTPEAVRAEAAARAALRKRLIARLDDAAAAEAERRRRRRELARASRSSALVASLWARLPAPERERLVGGASVTLRVPEPAAREFLPLLRRPSRQNPRPDPAEASRFAGPMVATLELDDLADTGFPILRARATLFGPDAALAGGGAFELDAPPRAADAPLPQDGRALPNDLATGLLGGTRDELLIRLAAAAEAPILSRHRAWGGTIGVPAGGRTLAAALAEIARLCEALLRANARGFYLLRSQTEALDRLARLPGAGGAASAWTRFLEQRPQPGRIVPLSLLAELAALSPLQLSVLSRSNVCSNEAGLAGEAYGLLQLYRSLGPAERAALLSERGLDLGALDRNRLHALLSDPRRNGGLEIPNPLEALASLRLRLVENPEADPPAIAVLLLKEGRPLTTTELELPRVETEPAPAAGK